MEAYILFLTSIITFSFFLATLPKSHCQPAKEYWDCLVPFNCGTLRDIGYPFWSDYQPPYCGSDGFKLNCPENEHEFPSIRIGSQTFNVTRIDPLAYNMTMVRTDLVYDNCSSHLTNTFLSTKHNLFSYEPNVKNVTLFYDCPQHISIPGNNFTCQHVPDSNSNNFVFYTEEDDRLLRQFPELHHCGQHIQVPVSIDTVLDPQGGIGALNKALGKGFGVHYTVDGGSCRI